MTERNKLINNGPLMSKFSQISIWVLSINDDNRDFDAAVIKTKLTLCLVPLKQHERRPHPEF